MENVRLTRFSHGAGCACKLGPGDLAQVLRRLDVDRDPALLVGTATGDDAAVWRLDDRTALVFTTDFFTPIVDDARVWGEIAAANAMSDVYAMGGRPLLCLNLVGWPAGTLPFDLLGEVLAGGQGKAREAGALVVGGHTIDDAEPKYGMAVVGLADPARLMTNAGARPADRLVLTKPIGVGVVTTAIKNDAAPAASVAMAVATMGALNRDAAEAAVATGVRGATDVTGFGLLGHLQKMLEASGAAATVRAGTVPVIEGARALAGAGQVAGGTRRNRAFVEPYVEWDDAVEEPDRVLLADAQTSGGLLLACPPDALDALGEALSARGASFAEIGIVEEGAPGRIRVATL